MASNKTAKNLVSNRNEYNAYYGDFRGVDFSSDHTQVASNRFAYLVNMYKDYKSANGTAIETIPGFRRLFAVDNNSARINGIHTFLGKTIVHVGSNLYVWGNFPRPCGIEQTLVILVTEEMVVSENNFQINLDNIVREKGGCLENNASVSSIAHGEDHVEAFELKRGILTFFSTAVKIGSFVAITYFESKRPGATVSEIGDSRSSSFQYNDLLMVFAGGELCAFHKQEESSYGFSVATVQAEGALPDRFFHIPTTYKNLVQGGDNFGTEFEQRNILSSFFRNEFYGVSTDVQSLQLMSPAMSIHKVERSIYNDGSYGWSALDKTEYSFDKTKNVVTIREKSDKDTLYRVTARYDVSTEYAENQCSKIKKCTVGCLFDNRVFLSGNPDFPNTVWFSTPSGERGTLYFGADDWFDDGTGDIRVTGMIPVSDNLLVVKESADEGGSAYLHSKLLTGDNIVTKAYPREQGLQGIGCIGACTNFYDDPVFISPLGVSALGQLSVRNERALEHRSTLIDAKITNMNLRNSFITEWGGYMLLFVDGCIFMADSRQKYVDALGMVQYEWYYIEGVGTYRNQIKNEDTGAYEGGTFCPATCARTINDNVYFGTDEGVVCGFNFDKRNEYGEILPEWYTFDGRTIVSGCATKMDNLGIPHLTKSTVKKSMVLKLKALLTSSLKVKVRTNTNPYKQIARIGSALFSFDAMDFEDFSFIPSDSGLFAVKEREKKWIEKQIYLYSDEHMRPFALYYIAYRYFVAGRLKN